MRILVTGGGGYIGSVLVPMLLSEGHHATVLDNFRYDQNSLLENCANSHFSVIRGDCREEDVVKNVLKDQDVIIPLAALVGAPLCDQDRLAVRTTNPDAVQENENIRHLVRSSTLMMSKDTGVVEPQNCKNFQ